VLQERLGYFEAFMRAWRDSPPATRAALYTEALEYEARLIEPRDYIALVSSQLGITVPWQT
jgi:hypothetical protein